MRRRQKPFFIKILRRFPAKQGKEQAKRAKLTKQFGVGYAVTEVFLVRFR